MKKLIAIWFCTVLLFFIFAPEPLKIKEQSSAVPTPIIAKLASAFASPLLADILWIQSAKDGEVANGTYSVDFDKFSARFKTIALLNGDFFEPTQYGSLFVATIAKKPDSALDIIKTAQNNSKDSTKLDELELIERIAYEKPPNFERIRFLAFNSNNSAISPQEAIMFAANDEIKKEIAKQDLIELEKNAKNSAQKEAVQSILLKSY
ncbi:MAG: hypothetical protein RL154_693 [Pseudomonadota bacterium]|jgi:hypothetical protein